MAVRGKQCVLVSDEVGYVHDHRIGSVTYPRCPYCYTVLPIGDDRCRCGVPREAVERYGRWFVRVVTDAAWFAWAREGSVVQEALEAGEITPEEARVQREAVEPEFSEVPLERVYIYVANL
jgi:hypothetical protein